MPLLIPDVPDPLPDPPYFGRPGWWRLEAAAAAHRDALAVLAERPLPPPAGSGVGLVTAGGGVYWPMVLTQLRMLRHVDPDLPVEVWHRGTCEPVDPAALAGLGAVTVRDADAEAAARGDRRFSAGRAGGWATKLYALANSRFETAIFLDADAYPVAPLTPLAEAARAAGGFAHWLDVPAGRDNVKWPIVWPAGPGRTTSFQGGQFAVHRPAAWRELVLAKWACDHADFYFAHQYHLYGDQDAVRLAHAVTGRRAAVVGRGEWRHPALVCHLGDTPLVVHRIGAKLFRPQDGGRHAPHYALPAEDRAQAAFAAALADAPGRDPAAVFSATYARGLWGDGSGPGSRGAWAQAVAALVNGMAAAGGWKTAADAGCGDGVVASSLWFSGYTGVDACAAVVDKNRERHPGRAWACADFYRDLDALPAADVLLVKDVLNHWPNAWVVDWVARVRRAGRWRAVLFVQDAEQRYDGEDTYLGGHRGLDPTLYPLNTLGLTEAARLWTKAVLMLTRPAA